MGTWLIAGLLIAVCVAAAVTAAVLQRRVALHRRVLVSLVDGKAIAGVLWSRRGSLILLKDATLHQDGAEPAKVDGEILVDRARIDFVQVL